MAASQPRKLQSSEGPQSLFGSWFMAVIWCGLSGGATYGILYDVGQGAPLWVKGMVVLFDVIGVCLLYAALKGTLGYFRFGKVYLTLTGDPPAAGRVLSAVLDLPDKAAGTTMIKAELACISLSWSRDSDNRRSRSESDLWSVKRDFPVRRGVQGGSAVLRIDIPAHLPPSDEPGEEGRDTQVSTDYDYHRWELRVTAEVPGLDLARKFPLQVLPGPAVAAGAAGALPASAMPISAPVLAPGIEKRIEARRAAERKLSALCAFVGITPFAAPFAIAGLAAGLAGCPMSWSNSQPPSCVLAGIDWGPVMVGAFDTMPYAIPAGIAGSALFYFLGQLWLARRFQTSGFGGQGGWVIALVALGFVMYQAWQFARPIRSVQPVSAHVQQPVTARQDATGTDAVRGKGASAAAGTWQAQEGDEEQLKKTLVFLDKDGGSSLPAAGMAQYQLSQVYERQRKTAAQEQALLSALAILERYPGSEVRKSLGPSGAWLDKEVVARRLGDFYWDQRRYDNAYQYYDRAYRYVSDVEVSDFERNRRLARNSAGRMVGACTQGNWAVADQAMKELKERIVNVDAETRKQLDYWIRTGEPRLAARKC